MATSISIVSPDDQKVAFVELFFDLVFVYGVTQWRRSFTDISISRPRVTLVLSSIHLAPGRPPTVNGVATAAVGVLRPWRHGSC